MSATDNLSPSRVPSDGRRRVATLAVRPEVDGGRYPVKRVLGETLAVEADVVTDGHDVIAAVLQYRHDSERTWTEVPLEHAGNDAWHASVPLRRLGRYRYTVVAWVDTFASWQRGLQRKFEAGTDVAVELLEGAVLVDAAVARGASLAGIAAELRSPEVPIADRVARAISTEVSAELARFPDRTLATVFDRELEVVVERPLARCSAWYELFPRSTGAAGVHGTFIDAERRLDYVAELGFDIVYLPPIHPIGRAFRKGPDNAPTAGPDDPGSPWAIGAGDGGHTSVHPDLGTLDDFDRFVRAARERRLEVALDIAFQASPDHPWVTEHPTWFRARPDGTIQYAENPPKKYQDVYPFDFETADWQALWAALRDVFVFWADRGIRVFRVDNPHTKPIAFWEWCLREVHARFPDAIFLAEAFTRPKLMYALAKSGFSQSYTYFTWRTSKPDLTRYLEDITRGAVPEFFRPNFWPTTPDIFPEHLVEGERGAFVSRLVLAATLSSNYGIYGPSFELMEHGQRPGVEELAQNEKYQLRTWDLARADSLRHVIARINQIRRDHPALQANHSLHFHATDSERLIAYSKRAGDDIVLCIVNLDPKHTHSGWVELDLEALGLPIDADCEVHDLLGEARFTWRERRNLVELDPQVLSAHVFALRSQVRASDPLESVP